MMGKIRTFGELNKYIVVNVLGMIGLSCYILADTFFIAKGMGADGLTALNLAIPVYSILHGTGLMIGIGGATKYNILRAQEAEQRANQVFSRAAVIALIAGMIYLLVGIVASSFLSRMLGADSATFQLTKTYLQTMLLFAPFFVMNNMMLAFVRNDGSPQLAMAGMLLGSLANIVLDYIFIFPFGMGMFGAALATGVAPILSLCTLSIHRWKKKNQFHFSRFTWTFRGVTEIFKLGISAFVNEMSTGIVLVAFNLIILRLVGNTGVAAYGIIANISLVIMAIFTGIGQGLQPVVSKHYGADNKKMLSSIKHYVLVFSGVLSVLLYVGVCIYSEELTAVFNTQGDTQLAAYAVNGMYFYFIGIIFAGVNVVSCAYLSSIDKGGKAFFISILRGGLILLPVVFLLSAIFSLNGVWFSFPVTELLTMCITVWLLFGVDRKKI